jgi:hypothetical protein
LVIALSTVSILSLTVMRTIRLADQDIIRKGDRGTSLTLY